jgi:nucleotide-binding universal stress UspA family protein
MPATRDSRKRVRSRRPVVETGAPAPRAPRLTPRKVLVASDGSRPSSAAIKLARFMAVKGAWAPEIVTVSLPLPVAVGDMMLPTPPVGYETIVNDSVLAGIRQQVRRYGDGAWDVTMEFGRPASAIVDAATRKRSELIVLGLGRHGRLGQLLGAETAAHVARHVKIPMLAVHERNWSPPRVAVAAVDFSNASVRAALEALALLEPPARLHLVHVTRSYNTTSFADSEWKRAYAAAAEEEFSRLKEKLGKRPDIEISSVLVTGGIVEKVLNEARYVHADMVALGSHDEKVIERLMIGSTPAQLLREAKCTVLIAPPGHAVA